MNKLTTFIVFVIFLTISKNTNAQVGINTENPNATLHIAKDITLPKTTAQGILLPQFSTKERDSFSKRMNAEKGKENEIPKGLMIYNTTTNTIDLYNGTSWVSLKYKK